MLVTAGSLTERDEEKMSESIRFLEDERIYLRPLEMTDLDLCVKWFNDREVTKYLCQTLPMTRLAEEKWLKETMEKKEDFVLVIALKENDRSIGTIGLHDFKNIHRHGELGIAIGEKDCWSQGYGAEAIKILLDYAFNSLNLHKVNLGVIQPNARAFRCYSKCGFIKEGEQREELWIDGEYINKITMSILRSEYYETKK
ncbi:MAG: GNAT family N-acetyltransferase [Patescibacteria group bacterium]|nr:GNAT family N-acetyltransferase [Patescibacteria group bacterium]